MARPAQLRAITIGNRLLSYSIRTSRRARRLQVGVSYERGVEVVVPARSRGVDPEAFLLEHAEWILSQVARLDERRESSPRSHLVDGGSVILFGRPCPLRINRAAAHFRARYHDGWITVDVPVGCDEDALRESVVKLLRRIAREVTTARADHWCSELGETRGRITVRGQKTRWGSCSSDGNLSFNWRLVLMPPEVLDYVVAHEVVHLRHFDHGPGFQRALRRLLPDYRDRERWLDENGEVAVL